MLSYQSCLFPLYSGESELTDGDLTDGTDGTESSVVEISMEEPDTPFTMDDTSPNFSDTELSIANERAQASSAMEEQADKMTKRSKRILSQEDIGTNVLIPIPNVDRGKADPKNLLAIIVDRIEDNYSLGTREGM